MLKTVALFFNGQTVHLLLRGVAGSTGVAVSGFYESIIRVLGSWVFTGFVADVLSVPAVYAMFSSATASVGSALALNEPRSLFAHTYFSTEVVARAAHICSPLPRWVEKTPFARNQP